MIQRDLVEPAPAVRNRPPVLEENLNACLLGIDGEYEQTRPETTQTADGAVRVYFTDLADHLCQYIRAAPSWWAVWPG